MQEQYTPDGPYSTAYRILGQLREARKGGTDRDRGVYAIVCDATGDVYVGITSQSFSSRWQGHCSSLERGSHDYSCLQRLWDAYGHAGFSFCLLQLWTPADGRDALLRWEQEWIVSLRGEGVSVVNKQQDYPRGPHHLTSRLLKMARVTGERPDRLRKRLLDEALQQYGF